MADKTKVFVLPTQAAVETFSRGGWPRDIQVVEFETPAEIDAFQASTGHTDGLQAPIVVRPGVEGWERLEDQYGHSHAQEMSFAEFASRAELVPLAGSEWQSTVMLNGTSVGIADVPGEDGLKQVHRELVNNALLVNEPGYERFKARPLPTQAALAEYPELIDKFPGAAAKVLAEKERTPEQAANDRANTARSMTDEEARAKVRDDLVHLRNSIDAGDETERLYQSRDMAERAQHNATYAQAVAEADPVLDERVRNFAQDPAWNVRVDVAENMRRAALAEEEVFGEIMPGDEASLAQTYGVTLPDDWTGEVQVQPCVTFMLDGESHVGPAASGQTPEFWGTYARREDGRAEWLKDFENEADALELQSKLQGAFAERDTDELSEAHVTEPVLLPEQNAAVAAVTEKSAVTAKEAPQTRTRKVPISTPDIGSPLLHRAFVKDGQGNVRRLGEDKVALKDLGKKIRVVDKQRDAFQAAIEIAEEKGWKAIEVRGSAKFKAEAWYHAQLRGLGVKGYEPTEADKERLAQAQKRAAPVELAPEVLQSAEDAKALALDAGLGLQEANQAVGKYAGKVLGETAHHVVQAIGRNVAVLHEKASLALEDGKLPEGTLNINYKDGRAAVKAKELSRAGLER